MTQLQQMGARAKTASRVLATAGAQKDKALLKIADALQAHAGDILEEYEAVPNWGRMVPSQINPDPVKLRAGSRPRKRDERPATAVRPEPVSAAVSEPPRRRAVPDYLSRSQMELLKAIGNRPVTAAQLAVQTGQPVEEILSSLVELEIYGLIESHGPAGYTAL